MKKIELDICNGLDNIRIQDSGQKPDITSGMVVALCHKGIPFNVEIKTTTEDRNIFFGAVIKSDPGHLESCGLSVGDSIKFIVENICYPTQKD